MDHGVKVASVLANSFSRRCSYISESDAHVKEKAIQFGFVLGKSPQVPPPIEASRGFELRLYRRRALPAPVAAATLMSFRPRRLPV